MRTIDGIPVEEEPTFTFKKRTVYTLLILISIIVMLVFGYSIQNKNNVLEVKPSGMLYQNATDSYTGETNIQAIGYFIFETNFTKYQDYVKDYHEVCFIQTDN